MKKLLIFLTAISCFGAARTASVTGNWSSTATWGGASVPGNGDTITINSGITLTVDSNRTIGASPADCTGTQAIQNNSGILTIAAGVQLTLRGGATFAGSGKLNEGANSILEFDSSAASAPSTTHYCLQLGTAGGESVLFTATGTDYSNMAVVRSNASGGVGKITDGAPTGQPGGLVNFNYVYVLRVGNATIDTIDFWPFNSTDTFTWNHVICDTCGMVLHHVAGDAAAQVHFSNSTWVNSANLFYNLQLIGNSSDGAGSHTVDGCVFDGWVNFSIPDKLEITNTFFTSGWTGGASSTWTKFDTIFTQETQDAVPFGNMTNVYMSQPSTKTNPHFVVHTQAYDVVLDGLLFEDLGTTTDGDTTQASNSTTNNMAVQNSIKLPNGNGSSSGTAVTCGCGHTSQVTYNKNTVHLGGARESSGLRWGETNTPVANMYTSIKSNAFWDTSAQGWKVYCITPACSSPTDVVTGANADYNGGSSSEFDAGSAGKGYDGSFTVAPGAHDLDLDPGFVDRGRGLLAYDKYCGGSGTESSALAGFKARNSASWNSCYDISKLINWVRQGFAPQRVEYATAGSDGARIGAVQPVDIMAGAIAQ